MAVYNEMTITEYSLRRNARPGQVWGEGIKGGNNAEQAVSHVARWYWDIRELTGAAATT